MSEELIAPRQKVFAPETCARVGSLAAFGMDTYAIANILLISVEDVEAVKNTDDFKQVFSQKLAERTDSAISREWGWDTVEEEAIAKVLQTLKGGYDPRFALQAAAVANRAVRRTPAANKTIDATRAGTMIILTMNKNYIQNNMNGEGNAQVSGDPKRTETDAIPKRRADIPNPKRVADLLKISSPRERADIEYLEHEVERAEMETLAEEFGLNEIIEEAKRGKA